MSQTGDVLLFQTTNDGEINVVNGIIDMSGGLDTAAYLSLFGGNEDCSGRDTCPFTWWGNRDETDTAKKYISETQYLLKTIPTITSNLIRIEDAAKRDLNWFLDKKIASSIVVVASIPGVNQIKLTVTIEANGVESSFEFVENWKATTTTISADDTTVSINPLAIITTLDFVTPNTINVDTDFKVDWGNGVLLSYSAGVAIAIASGTVRVLAENATRIRFQSDTFVDINLINSKNITDLSSVCQSLPNLLTFNVSNTSKVTNFSFGFLGCTGLVSFPYIDTSLGNNFNSMFKDCTALLCVSSLNTTIATKASAVFSNTPALIAPNVSEQTLLTTIPPGYNYINPGSCP